LIIKPLEYSRRSHGIHANTLNRLPHTQPNLAGYRPKNMAAMASGFYGWLATAS